MIKDVFNRSLQENERIVAVCFRDELCFDVRLREHSLIEDCDELQEPHTSRSKPLSDESRPSCVVIFVWTSGSSFRAEEASNNLVAPTKYCKRERKVGVGVETDPFALEYD